MKQRTSSLSRMTQRVTGVLGVLACTWALPATAAPAAAQDAALETAVSQLELREIGPAVMGGRISDLAVVEGNPSVFYAGFASGGLWRTESGGQAWTALFDDQPSASIGAVTVAPSNPNVVWVGTGEPQNRQSSPYGTGVYKSLDAGRTWEAVGLEDTRHVGRIVIHPTNPDIVYVAAMGHLWGPNEQRGVFRTTDGGDSWENVLYIDEHTGAIDLVMDRNDPNALFVAMYQRQRTPWGYSADGDGSGIYRTLNGGDSWEELTEGLPDGYKGRIGLDIYRRDGRLLYAIVESDAEGRGLYRSNDRGNSWERISTRNPRPMYFSIVRIDPSNPERIYLGGVTLSISDDGGRTWWEGDAADGVHLDHHAIWIDPNDSNHALLGTDGGVASTRDGGRNWIHHHNLATGQFYQLDVDNRDPYWICGGLQDNNSWCGPSRTLTDAGRISSGGPSNKDWHRVWGGDGFWNLIDPTNPDIVYSESQNGNFGRFHQSTGETARLRPTARPLESMEREYRWHWNTPLHLSRHDASTLYAGANHLLRTRDRGMTWEEASPDLSRQVDRDTLSIMGMPVTDSTLSRNDGTSHYGVITEIGESPLDGRVLYAGTDDGKLWGTRDDGATWTDLTDDVPGLVHGMTVSGIEASHHVPGRVYVAFDGHRNDDYRPYVVVSNDFGQSWREITNGLPADASVNAVREHHRTPGLIFVGNEVGLYFSVDMGERWTRLSGNFPTVPVDDMRIHPRDNDLVIGTHGRSIWILDDVGPLEQIAQDAVLERTTALFDGQRGTMWVLAPGPWFHPSEFYGDNPPDGVRIRYWLAEDRDEDVRLEVLDSGGDVIRVLDGPGEAGIQQAVWDFRMLAEDEEEAGSGVPVLPGDFGVRLIAAGDTVTTEVAVRMDPRVETTTAVLAQRQEALRRLHDLNVLAHRADEAIEQVESRVGAVEAALAHGGQEADALQGRAEDVSARLAEVVEQLNEGRPGGGLGSAVEGIYDPPTEDQAWQIDLAGERTRAAIEELNALISGDFTQLERDVYSPGALPAPLSPVRLPTVSDD
jgi:photosystem II stability/assembly factor-like uncharacterized protein